MRAPREVSGHRFAKRETARDTHAPRDSAHGHDGLAPELHSIVASDGVPLRLTRYRAGDRGPVLLVHGLGVSSRIFTVDTIATNLLEFLGSNGFDVWLLDCRVSIDLPSSTVPWTAD